MNRQPGGTASARTAGTLLGEYTEGRQFVGWRGPVSATRRCRKPCAETPRCFTWNAAQMRARGRGPGRGAGMPGTRAAATRRGERPALFHVKRGRVRGGGRRARFGPKPQPRPRFGTATWAAARGQAVQVRGGEARRRATRPRLEAARGHAARGKSIGATSRKTAIRASKGASVTLLSRGRKGPEW